MRKKIWVVVAKDSHGNEKPFAFSHPLDKGAIDNFLKENLPENIDRNSMTYEIYECVLDNPGK